MIKFRGDGERGPVFGLGLVRGNIERLTAGQPIMVNLADLGGPPVIVGIMFGETELDIINTLKASGMIDESVIVRVAEPGITEVIRVKRGN